MGGHAAAHPQREGAKNRPTPKRRDQEAARKRPLVQNNPRELKRMDRAKRREESAKMRQAMVTGDEKHLPPRDKGPVRRFVRDSVDARFNLGEWLLPLMLAVLALSLAACSTAIEAVKGPELAPIGYPAALVPVEQAYLPEPTSASANSLWRTGARSFFGDQRARHVGDILTVRIDIDDRAQTQNSTQRQRSNDASAARLPKTSSGRCG